MRLFYPLVRAWCQRAGLQDADAADVAQEVFRALAGNIDRFRSDGGRNSFRGWLWGITRNQLLAFRRGQLGRAEGGSGALRRFGEIPGEGDASSVVEPADRHAVLRRAVELLRGEVEERTWRAFWRVAVDGHAPADVAADLGLTVNAVYLAKTRLLRRLRDEFGELLS
jgi:RNA polymerase sigma-70 factor (ECF subfamily)